MSLAGKSVLAIRKKVTGPTIATGAKSLTGSIGDLR